MAGHRSPRGRRALRSAGSPLARHLTAPAPAPGGPSLRTTVLVTAAAVGSVATGTFTALLPTPDDGVTTSAAADDVTLGVTPAASAVTGRAPSAAGRSVAAGAMLVPVAFNTSGAGLADADGAATSRLALLDKAAGLAEELAELHAEQAREQAERDRIDAMISEGGVDGWIAEALQIMDMPQSMAPGIKKIIMKESNGNPRAINNWDSNAQRGTPSQGLMQTIPATFRAFVHPELEGSRITDPVANITAGVRYMVDRYGMDTLEQGGRRSSSGGYLGY